jgi:hypothetical protein
MEHYGCSFAIETVRFWPKAAGQISKFSLIRMTAFGESGR